MTITCPKCASSEGRSIEEIYCECRTPEQECAAVPAGLKRQAAPPARRHPVLWLSMTMLFAMFTVTTFSSISTTIALVACASLSAWMAREATEYNRSDLPRLLEYWHRSFMCKRCGEVFVPG